jgi:hypothetical protein
MVGDDSGEKSFRRLFMKNKSLASFLVLAMISVACGSSTLGFEASATPELPTSSPTASMTPTAVPTATPNLTATVETVATQAADDSLAELQDLLRGEEVDYQGGNLLWRQNEPMKVAMQGPDARYLPFAEGKVGGNFILKSDVTWEATGILICGVAFRAESEIDQGRHYQFVLLRFSGAPAWAIEFNEFGQFKSSITKIQYSGTVNLKNGATNQLLIVARDEESVVFINGVRQGRYFDFSKQRLEGGFAVTGNQDSGEGSCEYANTFVWALK